MGMVTTLQKWGNSQGIRLPRPVIDQLHFSPGMELELTVSAEAGTLIISQGQPACRVRGRHRIEDLVAQMPKSYRANEVPWEAKGKEIW
jgi:antitoxin MazE